MKNMNKTNKNPFLKAILTLAIAAVIIFGFSNAVDAKDLFDSGGWEDYTYDYYQPTYDYEYDYYQPAYDYEYDYYQPSYDYEYDYYQPSYESYQPYSYSTPSYTPSYTPYYSTPSYSSPSYYQTPTYIPYTPTYSTPSYSTYTPPVYVPTQSQSNTQGQSNTGVNTNNNTSASNSSATATSANTNNNVNNNNNVSNNVNTNNVNVIVGTPIAQASTQVPQQPQYQSLDGNCYASQTNVTINQEVTFTANATGGSGNYSYSWYGAEGISNNYRTFNGRFTTPGVKTVSVTITSGGQSINRSCTVNVDQGYVNPPVNNLSAYCVASPQNATINQTVVWTAYVTGGSYNNSYYTYSWYGTDNLSFGNASTIQKSYQTAGSKTATVTIYGNGQTISATCYANVTGYVTPISNVTVIRQPSAPAPVSGVYLSQIPATGINFSMKVALFILGLIIWSAFMGYTFMNRSKKKLALAGGLGNGFASTPKSIAEKIQAFKLANMRKQGLIK